MEGIVKDFISNYGEAILSTIITVIAGWLGIFVKRLYQKYINDQTKKDVVATCVRAVEQIYKDIHGEDKLNKCIESASDMLAEKGIKISDLEIRMLIESAVNAANKSFNESDGG